MIFPRSLSRSFNVMQSSEFELCQEMTLETSRYTVDEHEEDLIRDHGLHLILPEEVRCQCPQASIQHQSLSMNRRMARGKEEVRAHGE